METGYTSMTASLAPEKHHFPYLTPRIKTLPFFAVREGILSFTGWTLKPAYYGAVPLPDNCFAPNLKQKGVDIKIGLDVAWVSFNRIAHNVLLVTGDSDFVPVIKTARRNGVFVYLFTLGHNVKKELLENVSLRMCQSLK